MKIDLKTFFAVIFALLTLTGGVISAHFLGIQEAKTYTDLQVLNVKKSFDEKVKEISDKIDKIDRAVERIKFILEREKLADANK